VLKQGINIKTMCHDYFTQIKKHGIICIVSLSRRVGQYRNGHWKSSLLYSRSMLV